MPNSSESRFLSVMHEELLAFRSVGQVRTFAPGTTIFSAGDPGEGFFVVESGHVRITAAAGDQDVRLLATIGPGDFFGEMAVLDGAPRSATATAEDETKTLFLGRDEFLKLLSEQPRFTLNLIGEFSARMRTLNQRYLDEIIQAERLATVGRLARATVHDFKTPLSIISLAADLVARPSATEEVREKARGSINKQVLRMNAMLQELIEFTRTGRTTFMPITVDYATFVRGQISDLGSELEERGVKLVAAASPPVVEVAIDPHRLPRLMHNLVNNAVDAMGHEGGTITLSFEVRGHEVMTEVTDTGPGIAPEVASRLFQPFATHGKAHGTGLGLSICKRIVEDHGGRIWARSEPGRGATFGFTLPLV